MKTDRLPVMALICVLLLTGGAAWWLSLRSTWALDVGSLGTLPPVLNGWQAVDLEMDQSVAEMLRADANLQRAYLHPLGYVVYVYIGYYGTARGGTPEHTPDVCYPAQGWGIEQSDAVEIGGRDGFAVREFIVEKDGERRLVHFWYRTQRTTGIDSTWALRLQLFWTRLWSGRGDGALVRLSTPIVDGDVRSARGKLIPMDRAVDTALSSVWPTELAARRLASTVR